MFGNPGIEVLFFYISHPANYLLALRACAFIVCII